MPLPNQDAPATSRATSIASRLCDWRLSPNEETFAYGGYEVDLSLWNTEKAFTIDISEYVTQKGRSKSALLPAETWRAKNVTLVFSSLASDLPTNCAHRYPTTPWGSANLCE